MISTQYIKLNMTPSGVLPVLYCSQYDIGRPLGLVVHNGSVPVDLDTYTVTIEATRTDGTPITAAVTTDDNIGVFVTTAEMTNKKDKYLAKLVLVDSGTNRVASLAFVMVITPATMDENAEPIQEDRSLYQQYTAAVQVLIAEIRTDIAELQNVKVQRYDTVAQMKADTALKVGMYAHTGGYNSISDGYGKLYKIVTTATPWTGATTESLANGLYAAEIKLDNDTIIHDYLDFAAWVNNGVDRDSYVGRTVVVNSPVSIPSNRACLYKSVSNAIFVLNDDLFTWSTLTTPTNIPNFVNCTFIGNGHSICAEGAYVLRGKFVNCNFVDCSIVKNGAFVQSTRFIHCTIANTVNNAFMQAKQVYDTHLISCQCESDNKATIIDAFGTDSNKSTLSNVAMIDCIFEGQTAEVVKTHDGDLTLKGLYTQANTKAFVKVLASNYSANAILRLSVKDCKIQHSSGVNFIDVDSSYNGSTRTQFTCVDSSVEVCNLCNTDNFKFLFINNITIISSGTRPPSIELSKVYTAINSIADFSTAGHIKVKKFPCLISFDSSDGGWHTNLYLVSLSAGNTPTVVCLSDQTKTPTAVYDSTTEEVDVTCHAQSASTLNRSAVLLDGVLNNLNRNGYYTRSTAGY